MKPRMRIHPGQLAWFGVLTTNLPAEMQDIHQWALVYPKPPVMVFSFPRGHLHILHLHNFTYVKVPGHFTVKSHALGMYDWQKLIGPLRDHEASCSDPPRGRSPPPYRGVPLALSTWQQRDRRRPCRWSRDVRLGFGVARGWVSKTE